VVRLISLIHDQASSFEVLQLKIKLFCSRILGVANANAVNITLRQTVSSNQASPEMSLSDAKSRCFTIIHWH
jgi:hypothetical protein